MGPKGGSPSAGKGKRFDATSNMERPKDQTSLVIV